MSKTEKVKSSKPGDRKHIMPHLHVRHRRNDALFDLWSIVHLATGVAMGWVMDPYIALSIMVLWEPLEVLVLSPLLRKHFNIIFGYESLRNSLSDIFFDVIGVTIGAWLLIDIVNPPFYLL